MNSYNILLIKEPSILTDGIIGTLKEANYEVVWLSSKNTKELHKRIKAATLIIVDLQAELDLSRILNMCKDLDKKTAVWTANKRKQLLKEAFKKKFNGYFYNGMEKEELLHALNVILVRNEVYIDPKIGEILLYNYLDLLKDLVERPVGILTLREWEVLELLSQGLSNSEIGSRLYIADKTVKNHVSSILNKLNVKDRTGAVVMAIKNNWISL